MPDRTRTLLYWVLVAVVAAGLLGITRLGGLAAGWLACLVAAGYLIVGIHFGITYERVRTGRSSDA